ncbi:hypothetical protein SAMN05444156_0869 [Verrucomicrobium sp. GAS474]|nr:hypothetical protein SAMN05444156_0869 [Verrucomicrobium sp. GAS474]
MDHPQSPPPRLPKFVSDGFLFFRVPPGLWRGCWILFLLLIVILFGAAIRGLGYLLLQIPHVQAAFGLLLLAVIIDAGVNYGARKKATPKQKLLKEIQLRLDPFLAARGFHRLTGEERPDRNPLLYYFVREDGGRTDLLRLQFDKYGRAKFSIRLQEGTRQAALVPSRYSFGWFRPRKLFVLFGPRGYPAVVRRIERLFPECEAFWRGGDEGPHLRRPLVLPPARKPDAGS